MNAATKSPPRASKGEETRTAILKAALKHASTEGFEAITIGSLAEKTGMSKSGLFAHFGSKEELQIATLDEAIRRFNEVTTLPALSSPRGLKRLNAMCDNWLTWTTRCDLTGCPMMTAITEFDDKPGAVRDALLRHMQRMQESLVKSIQMTIDTGEFSADTDPEQLAFEFFGILASTYRSRNLFRDDLANIRARKAFDRLFALAMSADKSAFRQVLGNHPATVSTPR
ncbi:MAG: TetR/AcrR family transcriptional regulator [Betaproteobacteria bacterium]